MLKNGQTYFKNIAKSCGVHTARFLEYVWPFFNIMYESLNKLLLNITKCFTFVRLPSVNLVVFPAKYNGFQFFCSLFPFWKFTRHLNISMGRVSMFLIFSRLQIFDFSNSDINLSQFGSTKLLASESCSYY